MTRRRWGPVARVLGVLALPIACAGSTLPQAQAAPRTTAATIALVGVNVLPMDGVGTLHDQTLVVAEGRIEAFGPRDSVEVPEGAQAFELPGRWVVPGLVDMHVHLFSEDELPLYLDSGITTVRNMWGWDMHLDLREAIRTGTVSGPRIFTSGRLLDGDPPRLQGSAALATAEQAREEVAAQARAGFDAIKIYDGLSPPVFAAVVLAARRVGLPVWGHPPRAVGLDGALAAGVATLEHLRGGPEAVRAGGSWDQPLGSADLARLAQRVRQAEATIVPTLIVHESAELSAGEQEALLQSGQVRGIPEPLRSFCCGEADDPAEDLAPELRSRRGSNRRAVVAALHREGVRILVGSDTGNPWVIPGDSFHEEMRLLREAGLSPWAVLRAATRDAAVELGAPFEFGVLAPGTAADLLVVSADPLEDPGVLRRPAGVMARGRWYRTP